MCFLASQLTLADGDVFNSENESDGGRHVSHLCARKRTVSLYVCVHVWSGQGAAGGGPSGDLIR